MGWKVASKQGTGKVLVFRLWTAGGKDAVEEQSMLKSSLHLEKKKVALNQTHARKEKAERWCSVYSPVFGEGARMAFTPNLRKLGSLLFGTDVLGEHDSRVPVPTATVRSGAPPVDTVVVAVGTEALADGTVRFIKAAGRLIRSRSSTKKLEWVWKADGRVWWSGRAAAGRYSPG